MKASLPILTAVLILFSAATVRADINATIEGTIGCAKCEFGVAESCSDALSVGKGDKALLIFLEQNGSAKTSEHLCSGTATVTASGTLESRDGKPLLLVSGLKVTETAEAKPAAAAPAPASTVTKSGSLSCAKCNLSIADSCTDVLTVEEGGTSVNYFLEENGKTKTSQHKCSGSKPATVAGTVEKRDGKSVLVVTSFE